MSIFGGLNAFNIAYNYGCVHVGQMSILSKIPAKLDKRLKGRKQGKMPITLGPKRTQADKDYWDYNLEGRSKNNKRKEAKVWFKNYL